MFWALGGTCSTMDSFRLTVVPHGTRFSATSTAPALTALGSSPEKANESLRLMAIALFATGPRPSMLIARIKQPGLCTIIMQALEKQFTTEIVAEKGGAIWRPFLAPCVRWPNNGHDDVVPLWPPSGLHTENGCRASHYQPCPCLLDSRSTIETAIAAVRVRSRNEVPSNTNTSK